MEGEREEGEGKETREGGKGKGTEGEGKGFSGPMSNYFLRACERLHGKTYYLFVCIRSCWNCHIRHEQS